MNNYIVNIFTIPFLSLPIIWLLVSNIYSSPLIFLVVIAFIIYFRKEILYNKIFWIVYYFFLSSQYFLIGYFGGHYDNSLFVAKLTVGFYQFLPMFVLLLLLINEENLKNLKSFKFTIFYFIYLLLSIVMHNNLNLDGLVFFRNFSMFIVSFLIGIFLAKFILFSNYFKFLLPIILVYVLFGYFEISQGWLFWRDCFNSYFITELKNAGESLYGMIGNKTTSMFGQVYLRMNSVYYEPHHLSLTLAYFIFIFYALKKTKLLKIEGFFFLVLFFFLVFALLLALVKAGYGFLTLSFIWLYILKFLKPSIKQKKKYFFSLLILNIGVVGILLFIMLGAKIGNTGHTHLAAALAVFDVVNPMLLLFGAPSEFQVLNSDSGFATIVFGIGFIGYFLFLIVLAEILSYLNRNIHPIKYYMMALVFAWFGTTHLVSSTWSPMASFLLFFLIGLSSRVIKSKEVNLVQNSSN